VERVVTIKQGEYRDDNLRIYVDEDGATITIFGDGVNSEENQKLRSEIHELKMELHKLINGPKSVNAPKVYNTMSLEETKDYSEEFAALQERFDALKETIERKVYLELQFQSRRINKLEKAVIEKREKNERTTDT
jgi:hypothetical protein